MQAQESREGDSGYPNTATRSPHPCVRSLSFLTRALALVRLNLSTCFRLRVSLSLNSAILMSPRPRPQLSCSPVGDESLFTRYQGSSLAFTLSFIVVIKHSHLLSIFPPKHS